MEHATGVDIKENDGCISKNDSWFLKIPKGTEHR